MRVYYIHTDIDYIIRFSYDSKFLGFIKLNIVLLKKETCFINEFLMFVLNSL